MQALGVRVDPEPVGLRTDVRGHLVVSGERPRRGHRVGAGLLQGAALLDQGDPAAAEPRQVEHVVHEPGEVSRLPDDHVQELPLLGAALIGREQLGAAEDRGEGVTELVRQHRQILRPSRLLPPPLADVPEDQDRAHDHAVVPPDGRRAVFDGQRGAVAPNQDRVVAKADHVLESQRVSQRALARLVVGLAPEVHDLFHRAALGVGRGPTGELLAHTVQEGHHPLLVGRHDGVADARQGDLEPLPMSPEVPANLGALGVQPADDHQGSRDQREEDHPGPQREQHHREVARVRPQPFEGDDDSAEQDRHRQGGGEQSSRDRAAWGLRRQHPDLGLAPGDGQQARAGQRESHRGVDGHGGEEPYLVERVDVVEIAGDGQQTDDQHPRGQAAPGPPGSVMRQGTQREAGDDELDPGAARHAPRRPAARDAVGVCGEHRVEAEGRSHEVLDEGQQSEPGDRQPQRLRRATARRLRAGAEDGEPDAQHDEVRRRVGLHADQAGRHGTDRAHVAPPADHQDDETDHRDQPARRTRERVEQSFDDARVSSLDTPPRSDGYGTSVPAPAPRRHGAECPSRPREPRHVDSRRPEQAREPRVAVGRGRLGR